MTAAVVEPVGRKANWSSNVNEGGGVRNEGYRNLHTTARSIILVSMGVTDNDICIVYCLIVPLYNTHDLE